MQIVASVMSVLEVNGKQAVCISIGLRKDKTYSYLGSLRCDFEQMGLIDSILRKVPPAFLDYKRYKWQAYLEKIMEELSKL